MSNMIVAAGGYHRHRAAVLDTIRVRVDALCNCGDAFSATAQRKATETQGATNARPRFIKRANVLIALRLCSLVAARARNFCDS